MVQVSSLSDEICTTDVGSTRSSRYVDDMTNAGRRLMVIANRLPVAFDRESGQWQTSPGGLVSALTPILRENKGMWVGWSGVSGKVFQPFVHEDIEQVPVDLDHQEYLDFYVGFCNGTLWPLYHDTIRPPQFHRHWWRPYQEVNSKFADEAAERLDNDDVAWVQDYQLQLVPQMLRERTGVRRIGFYLHIPFPPIELFATLPWRRQILEGLLGADVLAFQSRSSRVNFAAAAKRLLDVRGSASQIHWQGREVSLQVAPIGIDTAAFENLGSSTKTEELAQQIRSHLGEPEVMMLGVDRLDYTKGIDLRMRALHALLEARPDLQGRVSLVQIAVPSREDVEAYQTMRAEIEGLVGRINGDLGEVGRPPIHYLYRSLPLEELVAYYRAADVMLVTPLRDGMNLVAKEYVATRVDNTGSLVLSEFAGAAEALTDAYLVNPYDLDATAATMARAIEDDPAGRSNLMKSLRATVDEHDVYWWADRCLSQLGI